MKKSFLAVALIIFASCAFAQEVQDLEVQYNPNSLNPIALYEQHYKVRVWRNIDLREKQNKGFFAKNGEISKLIIDAVKSGELTDVYNNDSLTSKMSKEDFMSAMVSEQAQTFQAWDPAADYITDDIVVYNGKNYRAQQDNRGATPADVSENWAPTTQGSGIEYLIADISTAHLMEDIIFDKRRSRLYYDIQAINLIIPGSKTQTQLDISLGWFKYKDLEKY